MENRLKERLTGAAILVALIVLIVPEMFHGRGDQLQATGTASGEGPPLRSYTIDLNTATNNGEAHAAPMQLTPAARSVAPSATASVASGPALATAAPLRPAAAPVPAASPRQPSSSVASAAQAQRDGSTALSSGWSVQLGLFAKKDNAQRLIRAAQAKGFAARVSKADGNGLYRVAVTGLADRAAAEQLSRRLRSAGYPAAVMGPR